MKKIMLVLAVLLVALSGSGCATIVTGKYQEVTVTSDPPGAKVKAETGESIITPGTFHLYRNKDHVLLARYGDFEPQQRHIKHKLQGWFWGNILLGGIIGGVVDLASGSSGKLVPNAIDFDFTAVGQTELVEEPTAEVDNSRGIPGYEVKQDASGNIIKDKDGNYVLFPVYEDEQKKDK